MENTTQEIIYQFLAVGMSALFALLSLAIRKLIVNKINIEKYGFENDRIERIISNAIDFAEQKAQEYAKMGASKISGIEKLSIAREYIDKIDKSIVAKYAEQLDDMITRKIAQKWKS